MSLAIIAYTKKYEELWSKFPKFSLCLVPGDLKKGNPLNYEQNRVPVCTFSTLIMI